MDKSDFLMRLKQEGISENLVDIDNKMIEDRYSLRYDGVRWLTFRRERGQEYEVMGYPSENDALDALFQRLRSLYGRPPHSPYAFPGSLWCSEEPKICFRVPKQLSESNIHEICGELWRDGSKTPVRISLFYSMNVTMSQREMDGGRYLHAKSEMRGEQFVLNVDAKTDTFFNGTCPTILFGRMRTIHEKINKTGGESDGQGRGNNGRNAE